MHVKTHEAEEKPCGGFKSVSRVPGREATPTHQSIIINLARKTITQTHCLVTRIEGFIVPTTT